MYKQKNMPIDIVFFLILLVTLQIYYFLIDFFIAGIYTHYGHSLATLGISSTMLLLFIYAVITIALYLIIKGFMERTNWARKFTMAFLLWTMLWTIWGIIIGANVIFHFLLLVVYLVMISYLTTFNVKEYFKKIEIFTYNDYTLYKRKVDLKSGITVIIHFFSKNKPRSGTPTNKPDGYEVGINSRSNLPYLYKINNNKKMESKTQKEDIKEEENNKRKPSNVIYVVSKPQPGQVKGDWAVRGHGKIYSHHRKKLNAIKEAKKIAKQKQATVLIQNIDGKFRQSFKFKPNIK